jgi:hypothetical protein
MLALFRRSGADECRHNAQPLQCRVACNSNALSPEKAMSTLRIIPSPKVVTAPWFAIVLLGAAIIGFIVYAALYGNVASNWIVGP